MVVIQKDPTGKARDDAEPKPAWGRYSTGAVWIRCQCGDVLSLDHDIAADGTVSPSLWHDSPGCGWHIHGKLEGWA